MKKIIIIRIKKCVCEKEPSRPPVLKSAARLNGRRVQEARLPASVLLNNFLKFECKWGLFTLKNEEKERLTASESRVGFPKPLPRPAELNKAPAGPARPRSARVTPPSAPGGGCADTETDAEDPVFLEKNRKEGKLNPRRGGKMPQRVNGAARSG